MRDQLILSIRTSLCLLILEAACNLTPTALGQAVSGAISGYVYDSSDAVIAGATVTITNTGTGVASSRVTDDAGLYIVPNLAPGAYSVAVEAPGFRRFIQENVTLRDDSTVRIDTHLQLGAVRSGAGQCGASNPEDR